MNYGIINAKKKTKRKNKGDIIMFCQKCGNQIPDGSTHCNYCGAPLQTQTTPTNIAPQPVQPIQATQPVSKPKKSGNVILIAIISVLVVIVLALVGIFVIKPALEGDSSSDSSSSSKEKDDDDKDNDKDEDKTEDKDNDKDNDKDDKELTIEEQAEKALDTNLKNYTSADSYELLEAMGMDISEAPSEEVLNLVADFMFSFAGKFEYEIISSEKIDNETVNVTLEVETIDGEKAVEVFYEDFMAYYLANMSEMESLSEDEAGELYITLMTDVLDDPAVGTKTDEVVIEMTLTDGEWTFDEEKIFDIMSGDFFSALENFEP